MKFNMTVSSMALALSLTLSGCSTGVFGGSSEPELEDGVNPKLQTEEASFFSKSGAGACALGAATGVLVALLSGKKNAGNLVVGAAAGCAVAMAGNYALDKYRENYGTQEEQLDAILADVTANNQKTESMLKNNKEVMEADLAEAKQIEKDIKAGKAQSQALAAKAEEMDKNIAYVKKNLTAAMNNMSALIESRNAIASGKGGKSAVSYKDAQAKLNDLDAQIKISRNNIDSLTADLNNYTSSAALYREKAAKYALNGK